MRPPCRADARRRGVSTLEMSVALLVLTLTVLGLSRLLAAHARLVQDLDAWCIASPRLHVHLPTGPFERECGVAATLAADPPPPATFDGDDFPQAVEVLGVERSGAPGCVAARVRVVAQ